MGIFGSIRKGIGKLGDIGKKVAPLVGLVPGVGTVAGAGIGALSSLGSDFGHGRKASVGGALKSGVAGGLSGLAGSTLLGGKGIMGIPGALGRAKGLLGGSPQVGNADQSARARELSAMVGSGQMTPEEAAAEMARMRSGGSGSSGGGILNAVKNFITKKPGTAIGLGLGAANALNNAKQTDRATGRLGSARAMLNERDRPDLSDMFARSGNPYRRTRVA